MSEPSREQLMAALRRADAAGDTAAARAIAKRLSADKPDFSGVTGGVKSTEDDYSRTIHGIKLGARSTMEGVAGIVDLLTSPLRAGAEALGMDRPGTMTELAGRGADKLGLPRPRNATERVQSDIGRAISGSAVTMGAGGAMARLPDMAGRIGAALSAQPWLQTISNATGAGASGMVREGGGSQGAQVAAGLAGGLGPSALLGGSQAAIRGAMRGGETGRRALQQNVDDFARAGSTPTVGQGANNARSRLTEAVLRNAPGGAGVVRRRLEQQGEEIGAGVERAANRLSPAQGAERGGKAVVSGITGPSGFMSRFKAESGRLYDEVQKLLPPDTKVPAQATQLALAELTTPIHGAANTSGLLMNPKVAGIAKAFGDDLAANGGTLPYEAVKRLRSQIGELIGDSALSPDTPTRQLRRLYGAMSDDLSQAAVATGDARVIQAANRANNYYRAGMQRVDDIERVVDRAGGPEAVYKALFNNSREGGSTLRKVMQSLDGQAQRDLAATTLRRLGKANPSAQDELGEVFSPETYLTNWSRMAPEAKRALFDRFGPGFSKDLDAIAAASARIRATNQTLPNPSGSAVVAGQTTAFGALAYGAATLNPSVIGTAATGLALSNLGARALTNPKVVKWLAETTRVPAAALPSQISVLAAMSKKDSDLAELYSQVTGMGE